MYSCEVVAHGSSQLSTVVLALEVDGLLIGVLFHVCEAHSSRKTKELGKLSLYTEVLTDFRALEPVALRIVPSSGFLWEMLVVD